MDYRKENVLKERVECLSSQSGFPPLNEPNAIRLDYSDPGAIYVITATNPVNTLDTQ